MGQLCLGRSVGLSVEEAGEKRAVLVRGFQRIVKIRGLPGRHLPSPALGDSRGDEKPGTLSAEFGQPLPFLPPGRWREGSREACSIGREFRVHVHLPMSPGSPSVTLDK